MTSSPTQESISQGENYVLIEMIDPRASLPLLTLSLALSTPLPTYLLIWPLGFLVDSAPYPPPPAVHVV